LMLRDTDETRLLQRLATVLEHYPTNAPTMPQDGFCQKHGVQMTLHEKDGRRWHAHRTSDGFCKGR
jgi:hypothetical protein